MEKFVLLKSDLLIFFSQIRETHFPNERLPGCTFDPCQITDLLYDYALKNGKVRKIPEDGGVMILPAECRIEKCPLIFNSLLV